MQSSSMMVKLLAVAMDIDTLSKEKGAETAPFDITKSGTDIGSTDSIISEHTVPAEYKAV